MIDFELTTAQAALRDEAADWLAAHVPAEPLPSLDTAEGFELHRGWERTLADAGWAAISWPEAFGGRGATLTEWLIFEHEYHQAGAPTRVNQNGLFLLAPTLLEYGTDAQKARFLPPMASGREIWAQGWSEPDAGSDMAAVRTLARREGDSYVLEGQKTWVSRGAFADWMFTLVRTDPESSRHRGLSFLLVPLDADGVTVRPIEQLGGETGFAEVFLDGVVVSAENRIGDEHQGWKIAMATAGFERGIYLRSPGRFTAAAQRLIGLYHSLGKAAPDGTRAAVTQANLDAMAYALHTQWTVSRVEEGAHLGPESSFNKLFWSEMDRRNYELAMNLIGSEATLRAEAPSAVDGGRWLDGYLFSLSGPIYAGTNEIQRNIIAGRVLDLPREA